MRERLHELHGLAAVGAEGCSRKIGRHIENIAWVGLGALIEINYSRPRTDDWPGEVRDISSLAQAKLSPPTFVFFTVGRAVSEACDPDQYSCSCAGAVLLNLDFQPRDLKL